MILTILIVLLIIAALGGLPGTGFGYNSGTGYGISGVLGVILLVLLVLAITGHHF